MQQDKRWSVDTMQKVQHKGTGCWASQFSGRFCFNLYFSIGSGGRVKKVQHMGG